MPGSFARDAGLPQHNFLLQQLAFGFNFVGALRVGAQVLWPRVSLRYASQRLQQMASRHPTVPKGAIISRCLYFGSTWMPGTSGTVSSSDYTRALQPQRVFYPSVVCMLLSDEHPCFLLIDNYAAARFSLEDIYAEISCRQQRRNDNSPGFAFCINSKVCGFTCRYLEARALGGRVAFSIVK